MAGLNKCARPTIMYKVVMSTTPATRSALDGRLRITFQRPNCVAPVIAVVYPSMMHKGAPDANDRILDARSVENAAQATNEVRCFTAATCELCWGAQSRQSRATWGRSDGRYSALKLSVTLQKGQA